MEAVFRTFWQKTIKRCKQRVDGGREEGEGEEEGREGWCNATAMYRDDISQRAVRYLSGDGC